MARARIGLIGAGLMGHGLGIKLCEAEYPLCVIANRNRAPIDDLILRGATEAHDLQSLAQASDVIIFCVSSSDIVGEILKTIAPNLKANQIIIDTGTSRPEDSVVRSENLQKIGVLFADCPLTGGPAQASAGTLGVLCGGSPAIISKIAPILQSFATTIRHMGDVGSGHRAKLISNFLVTGMIALVSESFAAAEKANINPQALFDAMQNGSGNSGVLQKMVAPALSGNFNGYQFAVANALKDISYYTDQGDTSALSLATKKFFADASAVGDPNRAVSTLLMNSIKPLD